MAQARLPMRKIREVLRLKFEARLSDRQIAKAIGSARSTVQECLRRARDAGLTWPLPPELDELTLQARLYQREVALSRTPQPDFAHLHAELKRPGVTRLLLWQEYKGARPDGWQYSVFCDQYRRWLATQDVVLRQNHAPGEKLFVDYAGQTVPIVDHTSGEERRADLRIFVAVLGASSYTHAEATWTQTLPDWLGAHAARRHGNARGNARPSGTLNPVAMKEGSSSPIRSPRKTSRTTANSPAAPARSDLALMK